MLTSHATRRPLSKHVFTEQAPSHATHEHAQRVPNPDNADVISRTCVENQYCRSPTGTMLRRNDDSIPGLDSYPVFQTWRQSSTPRGSS